MRCEKAGVERSLKSLHERYMNLQERTKAIEVEISAKDQRIKIHLQRVGDLERIRRVLQHQLHEARGHLEPMDTEMMRIKKHVSNLSMEYMSGMRAAAVLERTVSSKQRSLRILRKAVRKQDRRINSLHETVTSFAHDVEAIVSEPGSDLNKWADGLLGLYRKYVTHTALKFSGCGADDTSDVSAEFHRQRTFMERSVQSLKSRALRSEHAIRDTRNRIRSENSLLVHEVNSLRQTVHALRNDISYRSKPNMDA
jgi:chromosome segregation ATPase